MSKKALVVTIVTQLLYIALVIIFPSLLFSTVFMIPIGVVAVIGHLYGYKWGIVSMILGLLSVIGLEYFNLLAVANFLSYITITFIINYLQFFRDRIKQNESDIQFFESQLKYISSSVDDVIVTINYEGNIRFISDSVSRIFQYSNQELLGHDVYSLFSPQVRDYHAIAFEKYKATRSRTLDWSGTETVCTRKDGTYFPTEVKIWEFKNGEDSFFTIIISDISYKKMIERDLKESEERYRAFIANSSEGIWRIELKNPCPIDLPINEQIDWFYLNAYYAECNDAMAQMYGYDDATNIVGKGLEFLMPRTTISDMFLYAFINEGYNLHDVESTEIGHEGRRVYLSNSMFGVVEDGKLVRGWGVQRDISANKQYNLEREAMLEELGKAKASAELANVEKDKFLANLSHELRTPLVSILGYSNLFDESSDKVDFINAMKVINKNAQIQLDMIDDLLDVSKVMANKVELHKEVCNINDIIIESIETMKPRALEKNIELKYVNKDINIIVDCKRFAQIVNNLLSNAIRFTDRGYVEITSRVIDGMYVMEVIDTGLGIDNKDFSMIFQPFNQVDSSSIKKYKGVGLGLSITKNLVELHNGSVGVVSELGKGSIFTVRIPVVSEDTNLNGLKILLAEDSEDNGLLLESFLKLHGANPKWVTDAKSVYEDLKINSYDIYLFDIAMPDEDGITLAQNLVAKGDLTPKVAITAHVTYKDKALANGFDMFITKPIDWDRLLTIKNLIKPLH